MDSEDVTADREDESPKTADPGRPRTLDVNGFREQRDQIAAEARRRYQVHLAAAFGTRRYSNAAGLAEVALDALTDWRYVDTGAECCCGCHPQLPTSDWHGYGFDCVCTKTREERKSLLDGLRRDSEAFWQSPEGQEITAAKRAEDADLQAWLASQADVTAQSDGGFAPEVWNGEVAGHRFYFRERRGQWRIELDLRPTGRFVHEVVAVAASGEPRIEHRETEEGDVIAHGDTTADGYGTTPRERVQFIVDKIRQHLVRASCALHTGFDVTSCTPTQPERLNWPPCCAPSCTGCSPRPIDGRRNLGIRRILDSCPGITARSETFQDRIEHFGQISSESSWRPPSRCRLDAHYAMEMGVRTTELGHTWIRSVRSSADVDLQPQVRSRHMRSPPFLPGHSGKGRNGTENPSLTIN